MFFKETPQSTSECSHANSNNWFNKVTKSEEEFCSTCPGIDDNTGEMCSSCRVREFVDYLEPKVIFYLNGKRGWLREGATITFTSKSDESDAYGVSIIDCMHLSLTRLDKAGNPAGSAKVYHSLQVQNAVDDADRSTDQTVEIIGWKEC